MSEGPPKPGAIADAEAFSGSDDAQARVRAWWRLVPRVLTRPTDVFVALRNDDDVDVDARSEPILAVVLVAGMAAMLLTPAWGRILDEESLDWIVLAVVTFIGGLLYGAFGYFLLGFVLWLGLRGVGVDTRARKARHVVAFAALPFALSILVTVPVIVIAFGTDWFRTGGADDGAGRDRSPFDRLRVRDLVARIARHRPTHDVSAPLARRGRCTRSRIRSRCRARSATRRSVARRAGLPLPGSGGRGLRDVCRAVIPRCEGSLSPHRGRESVPGIRDGLRNPRAAGVAHVCGRRIPMAACLNGTIGRALVALVARPARRCRGRRGHPRPCRASRAGRGSLVARRACVHACRGVRASHPGPGERRCTLAARCDPRSRALPPRPGGAVRGAVGRRGDGSRRDRRSAPTCREPPWRDEWHHGTRARDLPGDRPGRGSLRPGRLAGGGSRRRSGHDRPTRTLRGTITLGASGTTTSPSATGSGSSV